MEQNDFIIITGLSGAGKSTSLKYLEDLGIFCVDNLPPQLIPKFAQLCEASGFNRVAVAIDDSGGIFTQELFESMKDLRDLNFVPQIVYLDAPNETIVSRFSANYRKHPLTVQGRRLLDAIRDERIHQEEIRGIADIVVDTGGKTIGELKDEVTKMFFRSDDGAPPINITVLSFGYKYGIPMDGDLVLDARILPNPFYDMELRDLDGRNEKIQDFVFSEEKGSLFLEKIFNLMEFILPHYIVKGKFHLTVCIGCTGGRHRSVAVASRLVEFLKTKKYRVFEEHRDLKRQTVTH